MRPQLLLAMTALLCAQTVLAADNNAAPLGFLERKDLPYPQDKPLPMPETTQDVREHNKQVVLDFYKIISDKRQWTEENRKKYFQDDFIQHDPAEPNTSEAFFNFFRNMGPPSPPANAGSSGAAAPPKPRGPMKMEGPASSDSNGSPVNWMVAEGDIVVVLRHRNWEWKGGPNPTYNGIFVDVWRLKDGKIAEQWCSATTADANLNEIFSMMKQGKFPKNKNWD